MYVSDATRSLLNRSKQNYDAGDNLKAVEFYVVADYMRRKEFVSTKSKLRAAIDKAEVRHSEGNYSAAEIYIRQADEILAENPVIENISEMEDYITELDRLRKENNVKLNKRSVRSFDQFTGKFLLSAKILYGVGAADKSDIKMKHRPYGRLETDIEHQFTYRDVELSEEYGLGVALNYKIRPSMWISANTRVWSAIKTTGTLQYDDPAKFRDAKYSFRTMLVDVSLGISYYFYQSDKIRFYNSVGGGVAIGINKQNEMENRFRVIYVRYGDLYHVQDSYTQTMASVSLGVDVLPFGSALYLNTEVQFGQYFGIQEGATSSLFSLSFGMGGNLI